MADGGRDERPGEKSQGSPARERTRARMAKLFATAAASAMVSACNGYGVVDPLPPPARCPGVAGVLKVTATWKDPSTISVTITHPADRTDVKFEDSATSDGSMVVSAKGGDTMTLELKPNAGITSINVNLLVDCSAGTGSNLFLALTIPADHSGVAPGTAVQASLSDM